MTQAKAEAEQVRREFESQRRAEQAEIEARIGRELAEQQQALAAAKAKAAADVSRSQV